MSQKLSGVVVTISEVAKALEVCNWTVSRMIRNGELEVSKRGWRYQIPVESLRKWIFRTLGMYGGARICMQAERKEEISLEKSTHSSGLAWSYLQKRESRESTESKNDVVRNEAASCELEPNEAVIRMRPLMRKLALRLGGKDTWLRDDLFQVMALAILECEGRNGVKYYADRMESRALNYLRDEYQRGIVYEPRLRLEECVKTVPAADCSKVVALFRLARLPLSMLELFGVWLEDGGDGGRCVA